MILLLQCLLALGYTACAHLASLWHSDPLAFAAMLSLVAMMLVEPLLAGRRWAWLALPLALWGSWALYRAGLAAVPLLLVPVVFVLAIAWVFARTLRPGATPLITRILMGIEGFATVDDVGADLRSYTRRLTAAWALVLGALALLNLLLALVASPDGLLESLGIPSPWPITQEQWSWFANILNYGVVGGFFIVEFAIRKRRFPGRYKSFADFMRKMVALGPVFWRDLLR